MKTLIIAEKPSVGRAIAEALGGFKKKEGYLESDQYIITWAFGHLITLATPEEYNPEWKSWYKLPVIPEQWSIRPINPDSQKQLKLIGDLAKQCDVIVNACDAGREGELIFRHCWEFLKLNGKTMKRLWVSSLTPEAISKEFKNLRPGPDYDNLYASALARSRGDWLMGMNATRLFTTLFCKPGDGVLSVGRVQTPTLAVLVHREREIQAFKPETFHEVLAALTNGTAFAAKWADPQGTTRLTEEAKAQALAAKIKAAKVATVTQSKVEELTEAPPQLYDLTLLQREANIRYGLTADHTLKTLQTLYEQKLVTYPRTDSRYVTEDIAKTFPGLLAKLVAAPLYAQYQATSVAKRAMGNKKIVDPTKVTDHHAILPTGSKVMELSGSEGLIFDLVIRRFIAACMPAARDTKTSLELDAAGERLVASGKLEIDPGWRSADPKNAAKATKAKNKTAKSGPDEDEEAAPVPPLKVGDKATIANVDVTKSQTKAPRAYSEAALLGAMENAGKELDDEAMSKAMKGRGLGTPATRASVIERLKKVGFITMQGKQLRPTPKGEKLIELVEQAGVEILASAELTGDWELRLHQIAEGKEKAQKLESDLAAFVQQMVGKVKSLPMAAKSSGGGAGSRPVQQDEDDESKWVAEAVCPVCKKGQVVVTKRAITCTTAGCTLGIRRVICRMPIPDDQIEKLMTHGRTGDIEGFYSERTGKTFSTFLALKSKGDGVDFGFALGKPQASASKPSSGQAATKSGSPAKAGAGTTGPVTRKTTTKK